MADKATLHRAWSRVIRFVNSTLNTSQNGADMADDQLQACSNFIFDNGVLEKSTGFTKVNSSALESGAEIKGVFRSHDTYGNKSLLAFCNGKLKRWTGSAFTDVVTGLSTSARPDFLNWKDSTITVNGVDDAIEFIPRNNTYHKFGVEPPRFYKKVAYFESDENITHDGGGTTDSVFIKTTERTGKSRTSLKQTATAGATVSSYVTYSSAQNFSAFPNGATLSDNDTLCLDILHRTRSYVDEIYVDFWTSDGNYYRLTIDGTELDPVTARDNRWTNLQIKRKRFVATGAPAWNNINRVYFSVKAQTGTSVTYIDNVYFKNTPIEAYSYGREIDDFEVTGSAGGIGGASDGEWTLYSGAGTISTTSIPTNVKHGKTALKLTITNQAGAGEAIQVQKTFSPTRNFNQYLDGVTSPSSDAISFWAKTIWGAFPVTGCIIGWTVTCVSPTYGNLTYSLNDPTSSNGAVVWRKYSVKKSSFTGDQAGWGDINAIRLYFVTTSITTDLEVIVDDLNLDAYAYTKTMADMEDDETWVFAGQGAGGTNTDKTKLSQGLQSIYTSVSKFQTETATLNVAATDLTIFGAGEASTTDDYISLWVYWTVFNYISSIKLQVDINADDYATDYFEYEWTKEALWLALYQRGDDETIDMTTLGQTSSTKSSLSELAKSTFIVPLNLASVDVSTAPQSLNQSLDNRSIDLEVKKSAFTRFGGTAAKGWNTVQGYRIVVTASAEAEAPLLVYFDNLMMKRGRGLSGMFQWCCVFQSPDAYSAPSEWSNVLDLSGQAGLLSNLPLSQDAETMARHFFRRGGSWGDEARLSFTIYDNTTTVYSDSNPDHTLGRVLNAPDIPQGTIRIPLAGKWGPIFKGSIILYRDPEDYRRLWFSNAGYFYAWSELKLLVMDSDIQDVFLEDGVLYISCKNGMRRIYIPLSDVGPDDIEQLDESKPTIAPFSSTKAESVRALVSYDGPYLFDGQTFTYIGALVDTYFDEGSYDLDEAIVFYADRHLYFSVKTTGGTRSLLDAYGPPVQWRTSPMDVNCFCIFDGQGDNGEVYAGDTTGTVWQMTGYDDSATMTTKDFGADSDESDEFNDVILEEIHVIAKSLSATPGPLVITPRVNQADTAITLYASSAKSAATHLGSVYTLYRFDMTGEQNSIKGSTVGVKIAHTTADKHCAIKAVKLVGKIAPLDAYSE